jgi:hypothetical protein
MGFNSVFKGLSKLQYHHVVWFEALILLCLLECDNMLYWQASTNTLGELATPIFLKKHWYVSVTEMASHWYVSVTDMPSHLRWQYLLVTIYRYFKIFMLKNSIQYSTVQYSTVQCSTAQHSTVQCSAVQYSTVQYSAVQYCTVQSRCS